MKITLGTRKSALAMWQTRHVAALLAEQGIDTEIHPMETTGDKILGVSIHKIGSKGVFTEELEQALEQGAIDIAVHSAKDLPSRLPDGFKIIAFTEREAPHDVILTNDSSFQGLESARGFRMGTSSNRRKALLAHFYPNITAVDVRGNVQTRLQKLESGHCDGLILAYAGVHRMQYDSWIAQELDPKNWPPPVGQGSMALECHDQLDADKLNAIRQAVNHPESARCIQTERAFLAVLEGGCSIPAFGYAHITDGLLQLHAGLLDLDGTGMIEFRDSTRALDGRSLGDRVATRILAQGGSELLQKIRQELDQK